MESTLVLYFRPVMSVIVIRPDSAPAERPPAAAAPAPSTVAPRLRNLGLLRGWRFGDLGLR